MQNLNIYDAVKLTSLIKETVASGDDNFTLLSSGDRVSFLPYDFGSGVSTLKVYFNLDRIETSRADYMTDGDISSASIVKIIEELDEKVTEERAQFYSNL